MSLESVNKDEGLWRLEIKVLVKNQEHLMLGIYNKKTNIRTD